MRDERSPAEVFLALVNGLCESNIETGASASYPCIFVMRVRNGKIVSSRDYVDHLGSAEARGRLVDLLSEIGKRRCGAG